MIFKKTCNTEAIVAGDSKQDKAWRLVTILASTIK